MSQPLDPRTAQRLAKLCGLLGSSHAGERAAAAMKASDLVRAKGLTWGDVITVPRLEPPLDLETVEAKCGFCLACLDALTAWEESFLISINGRRQLSPKQLEILNRLLGKCRAYKGAKQ
jgi:hypothetical protein